MGVPGRMLVNCEVIAIGFGYAPVIWICSCHRASAAASRSGAGRDIMCPGHHIRQPGADLSKQYIDVIRQIKGLNALCDPESCGIVTPLIAPMVSAPPTSNYGIPVCKYVIREANSRSNLHQRCGHAGLRHSGIDPFPRDAGRFYVPAIEISSHAGSVEYRQTGPSPVVPTSQVIEPEAHLNVQALIYLPGVVHICRESLVSQVTHRRRAIFMI